LVEGLENISDFRERITANLCKLPFAMPALPDLPTVCLHYSGCAQI
jgi:hypothetical protein